MQTDFIQFIQSNNLCNKTDNILLGVSGGIDSVVMFHLFRSCGYSFAVAHCNFQLRDQESDKDEDFVKNLAENYDIPFYSTRFNTKEIAQKEGISIQMAARDLRYEWFEEIRKNNNYKYIAIAHNKDDIIETFFINLTRGTGIKGLTGIKSKSRNIIRPLLFASRKSIEDYLKQNNYLFREDSSNKTIKYSRNLIRHEIIPALEMINPKFRETMTDNIKRIIEVEQIYLNTIEKAKESIITVNNNKTYLNINQLKDIEPLEAYMHEILNPYGFSNTQIHDIIASIDSIPGKQFISQTHRLIRDRSDFIIEEYSAHVQKQYYIEDNVTSIEYPVHLNIEKFTKDESFEITRDPNTALLDADLIEFPLTVRRWKNGDYFMPLGMKNLKKLSDFFIDNKVSISDKENTWLIESRNKIIWVVGMRIDDRFKITENTRNILRIRIF